MAIVVKNPPGNTGDLRDTGSIPGSGRYPGGGNGNPLQYSCLENSMDREAWWATVHRVAQSWTRLKWVRTHTHNVTSLPILERCWYKRSRRKNKNIDNYIDMVAVEKSLVLFSGLTDCWARGWQCVWQAARVVSRFTDLISRPSMEPPHCGCSRDIWVKRALPVSPLRNPLALLVGR